MGFIKLTLLVLIIAIALNYLYNYFSNTLPPVVEGYFHPRFRKVAEKLRYVSHSFHLSHKIYPVISCFR